MTPNSPIIAEGQRWSLRVGSGSIEYEVVSVAKDGSTAMLVESHNVPRVKKQIIWVTTHEMQFNRVWCRLTSAIAQE
jgi:hypothetical protein